MSFSVNIDKRNGYLNEDYNTLDEDTFKGVML